MANLHVFLVTGRTRPRFPKIRRTLRLRAGAEGENVGARRANAPLSESPTRTIQSMKDILRTKTEAFIDSIYHHLSFKSKYLVQYSL